MIVAIVRVGKEATLMLFLYLHIQLHVTELPKKNFLETLFSILTHKLHGYIDEKLRAN